MNRRTLAKAALASLVALALPAVAQAKEKKLRPCDNLERCGDVHVERVPERDGRHHPPLSPTVTTGSGASTSYVQFVSLNGQPVMMNPVQILSGKENLTFTATSGNTMSYTIVANFSEGAV